MKKFVVIVMLLFACVLTLASCGECDAVLSESKEHEVAGEVNSLDVIIGAADFKIEHGSTFLVESNLKYLSVDVENGVLTIVDNYRGSVNYQNASLTVYIPKDATFDDFNISTGAAKLTSVPITATNLELELGAGDVCFDALNVSGRAEIEGGAGKFTIGGGVIHNLALEMGVGELNLTAALIGNSDLDFGVGASNVNLVGSKDDYRIDIDKGIGGITIDGVPAIDFGSFGKGDSFVDIEGGIGAINLKFVKE